MSPKKKEDMEPILPVTSPDAAEKKAEADASKANIQEHKGQADVIVKPDTINVRFNRKDLSKILKENIEKESKRSKTKCDAIFDILAFFFAVLALFTLGFICGRFYTHYYTYHKLVNFEAQFGQLKHSPLWEALNKAFDEDGMEKVYVRFVDDKTIDVIEPKKIETPKDAFFAILGNQPSMAIRLLPWFDQQISETKRRLSNFSETFSNSIDSLIIKNTKFNRDKDSFSLGNMADDLQSSVESFDSLARNIRKDFNDLVLSTSQWNGSIYDMNAASREALLKFRKFYEKPNDSWSKDEIIEAVESLKSSVSRYVFRVENELEKFFYSATTSTTTMPWEEDIVGYDEEISLENYDEEREDKDEEDEDDNDYGSEAMYNYRYGK